MKKKNDVDMLAAIVLASNRYAMRPALVLDDRTYTYQELFGLAGSICETLRNLKENTSYTFNQEKPYVMGGKEYGRRSSKVVRFNRSFGFTINNFSVSGFLPSEFDIHDFDVFGAAYYNGRWKGVRFTK